MKKTHTDTAATNGRGLDRRTFIELTGALLGSTVLGGVPHAAHALDKALPNTIDGAVNGGTLDAMEKVPVDAKHRPVHEIRMTGVTIHANPIAQRAL